LGSRSDAISRSAVDLPQPDGPSRDTNSPSRTSRSKFSSAITEFANVLPTRRSARMGAPGAMTSPGLILRAQVEADALVDELQRIALAEIDPAADHAGARHLVEEALHPRIGHRADAALARIAGIDDAVALELVDRIADQLVGHLGIVLADECARRRAVAVEEAIPAENRGIDEAPDEVRPALDQIAARLDQGRIGVEAVIRQQEDLRLEAALL